MQSYTHKATMGGKSLLIGLNLPIYVTATNGVAASWEVFHFMRGHKASHIWIHDGICQAAFSRSFVMGAAIKGWRLTSDAMLLFPLDNAVYIAHVEGFGDGAMIAEGTERVVAVQEAVELASKEDSSLLVKSAGTSFSTLQANGIPITENSVEISRVNFCRAAALSFFCARLVHPQHVLMVLTMLFAIGFAADSPSPNEPGPIPLEVREAGKFSHLRPDLDRAAASIGQLNALRLHGLERARINDGQIFASGTLASNSYGRLRQITSTVNGQLNILNNSWELRWPAPRDGQVEEIELRPVSDVLDQIFEIGRSLDLATTVQSYQDGGLGAIQAGPQDIQNYQMVTVVFVSNNGVSPIRPLAAAFSGASIAGQLIRISATYSQQGLKRTVIEFSVRGRYE